MGKPAGWMDQADLSPLERDLLDRFRSLSADAQEYTLSWIAKLRGIDSQN
jgi:hypothetical protein